MEEQKKQQLHPWNTQPEQPDFQAGQQVGENGKSLKSSDMGRSMLQRAKEQRRELRKGHMGPAPMSSKLQRYALILQILAGFCLPLQEYWQLRYATKPTMRLPEQAWFPGLLVNLLCLAVSALIVWLDSRGVTAPALLPSRKIEKRILLGISAGFTVLVALLWLILG